MNPSLARLLSRRRVLMGLGVVFALCVVAFIVEAVLAAYAMNAARTDGNAVASSLTAGDLKGAQAAARRLADDAQRAHSSTDDPLWWIGSHLPFVGSDVGAVRDSATALDAIANHSLPVLLQLAGEVEHGSLRPHDGGIAPAAIAHFAPEVRQAADALDGPASAVAAIDVPGLIPPLDSLMQDVQDRIVQAKVAIDAAANAFQVLPTVLGGSGPRDYLLLVQNPAEIRASGGLPGTWAIIHAEGGRLTMTSTTSLGVLNQQTMPVHLSAEEAALFGSGFGKTANDITATPDFPRAAQIATEIERRRGVRVSAVFAADPVALAYVLAGTGPVTLQPGAVLTSQNAVSYLLNGLYQGLPIQETQNTMFALAARKTFNALVNGQGNQVNAIRGLVQAVVRHRVFAWSADPALARTIDAESLTGGLPTDTGSVPQVGVYLNDAVAGKPEYYLRQSSAVTATGCDNGVQTLKLQTSLQSVMPVNFSALSQWIIGTGAFAPQGHIVMTGMIIGPWKGTVDSLTIDGQPVTVTANELDGRQVALVTIDLLPGQLITLTATLHTGPGQSGAGKLTWTPGMTTDPDPSTFASAC